MNLTQQEIILLKYAQSTVEVVLVLLLTGRYLLIQHCKVLLDRLTQKEELPKTVETSMLQ